MAWASPALTLGWEGLDPQPPCRVAYPLWAALARDLNSPGVRTVPAGQPDILAAQWHAGEAPVLTAAANPAVGLEGLPIPVLAAVHLTGPVILSPCGGETGPPSVIPNFSLGKAVPATSSHGPLGSAGTDPTGEAVPLQLLSTAKRPQPLGTPHSMASLPWCWQDDSVAHCILAHCAKSGLG